MEFCTRVVRDGWDFTELIISTVRADKVSPVILDTANKEYSGQTKKY